MSFLKWLKNIFKVKEINQEINNTMISKLAIIVGHGNGDPGAKAFNGINEFDYNLFVADYIKRNCTEKIINVFYRGIEGIGGVCNEVMEWKADASIELHLNSYNGIARGCEVLCLTNNINGEVIALAFAKSFTEKFNRILRRDRGINWIRKGDRGYYNLASLDRNGRHILVEPFFCDNKDEWIEPIEYAKFLVEFINNL